MRTKFFMAYWLLVLLISRAVLAAPTLHFDESGKKFQNGILHVVEDLERTPTGKDLLERLSDRTVTVAADPSVVTMLYTDSNQRLSIAPAFYDKLKTWEVAHIFAHEMEHAYQQKLALGKIGGDSVFPVRELMAFSLEARVWVEMGGNTGTDPMDLSGAGPFIKDMWTWLKYPWTAMTGWCVAIPSLNLKIGQDWPVELREYWQGALRQENSWRETWHSRFPIGQDVNDVALIYLNTMTGYGLPNRNQEASGDISRWLPETIDQLALRSPGEEIAVPTMPSAKDLFILQTSPVPFHVGSSNGRTTLIRD